MQDAPRMRCLQRRRDLQCHVHGLRMRQRPARRLPFEVFQHEVIGADVIDLANMRVIQSGNRASFQLKTMSVFPVHALDGDDAIQPRVPRLPHLSHPARANAREDLIRTDAISLRQGHDALHDSTARQGALFASERITGIRN